MAGPPRGPSLDPAASLVDAGNPFTGPQHPANLTVGRASTPAGERVVMTVRQAGATLTVLLDQRDAKTWAAELERAAAGMTGLVVPPGLLLARRNEPDPPSPVNGSEP